MKLLKGECKWKIILTSCIGVLSIAVNIYLSIHSHNLNVQLDKAKEPKPTKEIKILADSRKINDKFETQAFIKIGNLGLTREKDFKFEIWMETSYEITEFETKSLIDEDEEKRKSHCRTYVIPILYGQGSFEGVLTFRSYIEFKKGEIAHPIKIKW